MPKPEKVEPKSEKVEKVASLERELGEAAVAVFMDFRGLGAQQMVRLRRQLSEAGGRCQVVKNTLARLALTRRGAAGFDALLDGSTAIAFGRGNEAAAPRLLQEFIRTNRSPLRLKGGLLGTRVLGPQELALLAASPPRETLIAEVAGSLKSPLTGLVSVLSGVLGGLVMVLQARTQQLEQGGKSG